MAQDNDELDFERKMLPEDVEAAFNWILQNDQKKFDIYFYETQPEGDSSWVVWDKSNNLYAHRQAIRLTFCFALKRLKHIDEEPPFVKARQNNIPDKMKEYFYLEELWRGLGFKCKRKSEITKTSFSEATGGTQSMNKSILHQVEELFEQQFRQIILFGPPGTGKTYSAQKILEFLFDVNEETLNSMQSKEWDIVQFHPSYNYEDFVRGIKVGTTSEGQIKYETENRIFGEMCERAEKDEDNNYALIIDEINRANVSAVLGELIYALEYRGKPINTPYVIGDSAKLTIPKNLYVIGTMNAADRTIGQIDYAVRRRFSFVPCPPDESVINGKALDLFKEVDVVFNEPYLSPDFPRDDIRIGHSYFLAKDNKQLAYKILYQVVPILREYVKDGVLLQSAEEIIEKIRKEAEGLLLHTPGGHTPGGEEMSVGEGGENGNSETLGKPYFYWRYGNDDKRLGVGGVARVALSIIKDFIENNPEKDVSEINNDIKSQGRAKGFVYTEDNRPEQKTHYFHDTPILHQGKVLFVDSEWVYSKEDDSQWERFKDKMKSHGYSIGLCHLVNLGESNGNNPCRTWEDCFKYKIVSANGKYSTTMGGLEEGDLLFVRLAAPSKGEAGYIACAEVKGKKTNIAAVLTEEDKLLADTFVDNERKYREKYEIAFDEKSPDFAVKVNWLRHKLRNEAVSDISAAHKFSTSKIQMKDIRELRKAFDIPGWDK